MSPQLSVCHWNQFNTASVLLLISRRSVLILLLILILIFGFRRCWLKLASKCHCCIIGLSTSNHNRICFSLFLLLEVPRELTHSARCPNDIKNLSTSQPLLNSFTNSYQTRKSNDVLPVIFSKKRDCRVSMNRSTSSHSSMRGSTWEVIPLQRWAYSLKDFHLS